MPLPMAPIKAHPYDRFVKAVPQADWVHPSASGLAVARALAAKLDAEFDAQRWVPAEAWQPVTSVLRAVNGKPGVTLKAALYSQGGSTTPLKDDTRTMRRITFVLDWMVRQYMPEVDTDEYVVYQARESGLIDALERAGFRLLGSGYFSLVLEHRRWPEHAIKVGLRKEDAGAAWAAWARANPGPHIPVIYSLERRANCWVAIMPRYVPVTGRDEVRSTASEAMKRGVSADEMATLKRFHSMAFWSIVEVAARVGDFFRGMAQFDLHDANVMMHPRTHQIVFTDPLSYTMDGTRLAHKRTDAVHVERRIAKIQTK